MHREKLCSMILEENPTNTELDVGGRSRRQLRDEMNRSDCNVKWIGMFVVLQL